MIGTHEFIKDNRNENILIYVNGDLVPRHEAKVSIRIMESKYSKKTSL